jgi:uncharacterized Zn finger protein (UPF0148 family)
MPPRLKINRLLVSGRGRPEAAIDFGDGLTLITGLSNTGKSHILECIDFALAGPAPRPIPEAAAYDWVALQVTHAAGTSTIVRSFTQADSGNALLFEGSLADWDGSSGTSLPVAIAGTKTTLSRSLLEASGFEPNTRIVRNQRGESQSLSFRNVSPLVLIREEEMISESSPILPSSYTQHTSARSAFNILVTGKVPTAEELAALSEAHTSRDQAGQYASLLDGVIDELRAALLEEDLDRQALEAELANIDDELANVSELVSESGARVRNLIDVRNRALADHDKALRRAAAASELANRFALLGEHYQADIQRLEFALEAGHFFDQIAADHCPRCGRPLDRDDYCHTEAAEFAQIERAARVEIGKLQPRLSDLSKARADAMWEVEAATVAASKAQVEAQNHDREIRAVANPTAESARARVRSITNRRREVEDVLTRFRELDRYIRLRDEARAESKRKLDRSRVEHDISGIHRLSDQIRNLLVAWKFPVRADVFFDTQTNDLVIDGKARNANGKGVRAVTHAAFTIGLMEHCFEAETPHPGFVVIDTPLTPFRGETDDVDDPELTRNLHAAFLHTLANEHVGQAIVMENVDPPVSLYEEATVHVFTGPEGPGRRGFYPSS